MWGKEYKPKKGDLILNCAQTNLIIEKFLFGSCINGNNWSSSYFLELNMATSSSMFNL
jgi:hypothetical protein